MVKFAKEFDLWRQRAQEPFWCLITERFLRKLGPMVAVKVINRLAQSSRYLFLCSSGFSSDLFRPNKPRLRFNGQFHLPAIDGYSHMYYFCYCALDCQL